MGLLCGCANAPNAKGEAAPSAGKAVAGKAVAGKAVSGRSQERSAEHSAQKEGENAGEEPMKPRRSEPERAANDAAAEAAFNALAPQLASFQEIRLVGGAETQSKHLKRKLNVLLKLTEQYKKVVTGYPASGWSVCATVTQGHLWANMRDTVEAVPQPEGLTDEQFTVFRESLNAMLDKFTDAAKRYYEKATARSLKLGVTHRCVQEARDALDSPN